MGSLYAAGWRQGSSFEKVLELSSLVEAGGAITRDSLEHGEWMVVTQDCDLDIAEVDQAEPTIELRPVFADDPPSDWGIRSARFLIDDAPPKYLRASSPRLFVSPAVLSLCGVASARGISLDRVAALKTWLGLRYDRPAVPPGLVTLARSIAAEVKRGRSDDVVPMMRDILMQFDEAQSPPRFSLYAIVLEASAAQEARRWLAEVALRVPASLGVPDVLEAGSASQISLELVETSFAADTTQISWGSRPASGTS